MSVNTLLFPNQFNLNAQTINISGIASNLVKIAPIITSSNVLCSNLYVQRAVTCDTPGNIASSPFTITNSPIPTYVLTGIDATHASWQEIPEAEPAKYLMTDTGSVKIYNSDAPGVGDVLIALSATEAAWGPQSGSGSNIAAFLETTGAPVMVKSSAPPSINQVLRATSATNAEWADVIATNASYANVSGYSLNSLHSEWSDDANIALTSLHANVATFAYDSLHADWSDTSNVAVLANNATNAYHADHAEWADTANLAGFAVDSTHSDWADFANSIATTTVTPGYYGDSTHVGRFVVNASGQLTQASNIAISFPSAGNLTGPITSVGLATSIASQTGTGSTFVVQNTPTLTTPNIGAATGTSLNITGQFTSTQATGTSPLVVSSTTKVTNLYADRAALADTVTTNANLTGPIVSVGNATSIASQTGTGSTFVVQTNPSITNPTISQITNTGVLTLPTTTDVLMGRSTTDSMINKGISDNSNNVIARSLWQNSGASSVSTYAATAGTTGQVLTMTSLTTAAWSTPASGGQLTFSDSTFAIYDVTDNTKQIQFDAVGTTGTKTTITSSQTADRVLTLPNFTDTLIGRSTTDTLINKVISDSSNNVIARSLWTGSGTGSVSVYASANPTTGQILTASNSTTATWASPSGGLTPTAVKTSNYTAVTGDHVLCSSSAGGFTITLPASPSVGNMVRISITTENADPVAQVISVGRNGSSIDGGTASEYELYHTLWKAGDTVTFEFIGGTTGWSAVNRNIRNRFMCDVYKSAAQNNITASTFVLVNLDARAFDYNANFDITTNYKYTAPISGLYAVSSILNFLQPGASGTLHAMDVRLNGTNTRLYTEFTAPSSVVDGSMVAGTLLLTAGQTLSLYAYSAAAGSTDIRTGQGITNMSITLITRT